MITTPYNIWKTGKAILKGDDIVDIGKTSKIRSSSSDFYAQPTILSPAVTKVDDTKPTWDELLQKPAILGEKPNPSSTQLRSAYNQYGKNVLERINLRNNAAANESNIQFLDRAIELSKTQGYGAVKYDDDVINAWVKLNEGKQGGANRDFIVKQLELLKDNKTIEGLDRRNKKLFHDFKADPYHKAIYNTTEVKDNAFMLGLKNLSDYAWKERTTGRELTKQDLKNVMWPNNPEYHNLFKGDTFSAMVNQGIRKQHNNLFPDDFTQYASMTSVKKSLKEQQIPLQNKEYAKIIDYKGGVPKSGVINFVGDINIMGSKNTQTVSDVIGMAHNAAKEMKDIHPSTSFNLKNNINNLINRTFMSGFKSGNKDVSIDSMMKLVDKMKNPEWANAYVDLVNKRTYYEDFFKLAEKMTGVKGVPDINLTGFDKTLHIGHKKAVKNYYELGTDINNLVLQGSTKNLKQGTNTISAGKVKDELKLLTDIMEDHYYQVMGKNTGGLVRPNMALGGDMAQYKQMESVVPDLNPDEAEMQLAMSFKNPFKLKKQPPLIDDLDTTLKIADQGPGTAKTATKTHTLDAGVGSDSIFYLKSDLELANSVQDKMTPQQWLGYLTKKGVSPTELDEFGLKNLIYSMGGWDESTKKWKNNKAISKSDLIAAYKNEKPMITYKINQVEPFEKGIKDFGLFISKRKSGGSYYHGVDDPMGDTRGLLNKPQDIAGDTMRQQLMKYFGNNQDLQKDWAQGEKGMANDFNRIYKQFYGIDNVVENGIPEGMKIPFYSRNLVDRFNRLRKGEGFYFQKGKNVRHEGSQFMPGGTGYIEIPFTYNPNPKGKRANEPRFTFGEGHFTNPEGNNPVFWMRASERVDEQGNRILFIEEIQSDMHQKVKQKPDTFSYALRDDAPGRVDMDSLRQQKDVLVDELTKVTDQIDKIAGHTDPSAATILERLKVKRETVRTQLNEVSAKLTDSTSSGQSDTVFPEGPFKKSENQTKIALKTAINLATKEGFDGVAMVTGKAKNKFANASGETAKGNIGFYDNIAVKAMKSVSKNLELDFSATNIKDGEGNTWARIPVINLKEAIINKSVDLYKAVGGYIHRPSFVDVVPTL